MSGKRDRDVEKRYTTGQFVAKLRRFADALESGKRFRIQIANERIHVPADAAFNIEHEREGGVVAHPMFPVAVTWPIIGTVWEFIESDSFPREILASQVHYTEHLTLHRLLRPGDEVVIRGVIAAILPHRG